MKKQTILSTLVLASGVLGLASCGGNTATVKGSYSYDATWGETTTTYGMAVEVKYDTKTSKITSVTRDADAITAGNFVEVTASWGEGTYKTQYDAAIEAQLKEYEGSDYTELYNKIKNGVTIQYSNANNTGVTLGATDALKADQQFIIIAGATQTAVRTAVAIANAIANIATDDALTPLTTAAYVAA